MDLNEIMTQARELQAKVKAVQDSLDNVLVKGLAGNGAVIIEMTGKYNVKNVIISPNAMKNSVSDLSRIVMEAFIDAKNKADVIIDKAMSDATGGIDLPL